jgi:hypothetical protein
MDGRLSYSASSDALEDVTIAPEPFVPTAPEAKPAAVLEAAEPVASEAAPASASTTELQLQHAVLPRWQEWIYNNGMQALAAIVAFIAFFLSVRHEVLSAIKSGALPGLRAVLVMAACSARWACGYLTGPESLFCGAT